MQNDVELRRAQAREREAKFRFYQLKELRCALLDGAFTHVQARLNLGRQLYPMLYGEIAQAKQDWLTTKMAVVNIVKEVIPDIVLTTKVDKGCIGKVERDGKVCMYDLEQPNVMKVLEEGKGDKVSAVYMETVGNEMLYGLLAYGFYIGNVDGMYILTKDRMNYALLDYTNNNVVLRDNSGEIAVTKLLEVKGYTEDEKLTAQIAAAISERLPNAKKVEYGQNKDVTSMTVAELIEAYNEVVEASKHNVKGKVPKEVEMLSNYECVWLCRDIYLREMELHKELDRRLEQYGWKVEEALAAPIVIQDADYNATVLTANVWAEIEAGTVKKCRRVGVVEWEDEDVSKLNEEGILLVEKYLCGVTEQSLIREGDSYYVYLKCDRGVSITVTDGQVVGDITNWVRDTNAEIVEKQLKEYMREALDKGLGEVIERMGIKCEGVKKGPELTR